MGLRTKDVRERLLSHIEVNPMTGCWEWIGCLNKDGYGTSWNGRVLPAHKLSYLTFKGPVTEGFEVCHTCDNRRCINPEHLWLGTHAENMRDAAAKGRMKISGNCGSKNHNAKLDGRKVVEIRSLLANGVTGRELAKRFGVTHQAISQVKSGEHWGNVVLGD